MVVWDVFGKRGANDDWTLVGGVKAPDDVAMALLLAREAFFRHKEGVAYAVRRRGDDTMHVGTDEARTLGGVTDRSYRRQEAYTGVGARLRRVAQDMRARGLAILDRTRPPDHRTRAPTGH